MHGDRACDVLRVQHSIDFLLKFILEVLLNGLRSSDLLRDGLLDLVLVDHQQTSVEFLLIVEDFVPIEVLSLLGFELHEHFPQLVHLLADTHQLAIDLCLEALQVAYVS